MLSEKQTCPLEHLHPVSALGQDPMSSRQHLEPSFSVWPGQTHRGDVEIVLAVAVREVGQLGHPGELLVQLLQQGGRVQHLLLVGLEQLVVQFAELLRQLQGHVQLLAQLHLRGVVG